MSSSSVIKRRKSRKALSAKDKKTEARIRQVAKILEENGYVVRREKLKRGIGWQAQSGECRAQDEKIIFVDRRLSIQEQLEFISSQASVNGVSVTEQDH